MAKASRLIALTAVVALGAACTVHQASTASPSGPSALALSITVTATPDRITQDGASQSAVQVQAIGPDGRPQSGVSLRMDMYVGGQFVDFGTLSARTIVTGSDGRASTTYTAPPPPPATQNSGTNTVTLRASAIGTNALASSSDYASAYITLVPPGVILPPAGTPTPAFTYSPTPVNVNTPVTFDASSSCAAAAPCSGTSGITSFAWTFGDGSSGTGQTSSHTFTATGTYSVTLTVTNDRSISASATQQVTVAITAGPTADFVFSPDKPTSADTVTFSAASSTSAIGHNITQYSWNFGDGQTASGQLVTHVFNFLSPPPPPGKSVTYTVVLSVIDDTGQRAVAKQPVTVSY